MRVLAWEGCLNVRDLGGLATDDGGETRFRRIVRADNIRQLSDDGWRDAVAYGIRTVLDLRLSTERDEDPPAELPVEVVHVSVLGEPDEARAAERSRRAAAAGGAIAATTLVYREVLDDYQHEFAVAIGAIATAPPGGVLVHCHGGKDRTGLVVALLLRVAGVSPAQIAADYALSEGFLIPRRDQWLAAAADDAERDEIRRISATPAEAMRDVLDELDRSHGSVHDYLRAGGLDDPTLALVHGRLLDE